MKPPRWLDRRVPYDHAIRRRTRGLGRIANSIVRPQRYPSSPVVRAFWFDGIPNFGDQLTPWLLMRAGVTPLQASAASADFVAVGSVLQMVPSTFDGVVWGSGMLEPQQTSLPEVTWAAVRGALTRELAEAPGDVALGDPGILVSRFSRRPQVRWRLGLVPHHAQEKDPMWSQFADRYPAQVTVINVRRHPSVVIRDIASCGAILSSSLHGLVVADSYGIPAAWTSGSPPLTGGDFKFQDYASAFHGLPQRRIELDGLRSLEQTLRCTHAADAASVEAVQEGLLTALFEAPLGRMNPVRTALDVVGRRRSIQDNDPS